MMQRKKIALVVISVLVIVVVFGIYNSTLTGKAGSSRPEDELIVDRLQGSEIEEEKIFTLTEKQEILVENFLKNLDLVKIKLESINKENGEIEIKVVYGENEEMGKMKIHNGKLFDLDENGTNDLEIGIENIFSPDIAEITIKSV